MNRVQTVTQKHHRVEKPDQKPSQVHGHQNWPSWAQRRAQDRPGVRMAARVRPYRGQPNAVSWPRPWSCHKRRAPYRGRCQRRVMGVGAVSRSTVVRARLPCPGLSRDTALPQALPSHNTACVLRYTPAIKPLPQLLCHDTISLYQDTVPHPISLPIAIQSSLYLCNTNHCIATQKPLYQPSKTTILQYKIFFHNIIWAVAQKRFYTKFIYFFIIHSLISSYWKNSKKKILIHIFFSHFL